MRRIRFTAVIGILSFLTLTAIFPVSTYGRTDQITTVVQSGNYRILPADDGERIVMDGFGYRMEPGNPMLPKRNVLIALPPGALVQRVEALGLGGTLLSGRHRIAPAPRIVPLAESPYRRELMVEIQREWEESNRAAYSTDEAYPVKIWRVTGSGSLRKYAYTSVSICPFSYRPLSGRLTHYDAVQITVHYSIPPRSISQTKENEKLMHDRLADKKASEIFVNYHQIKDLYQTEQSITDIQEIYDYVIITTGSLAEAISSSDFITWKTSLGYSVRTVLVTDPEIAGQSGLDLAEQIRNFLRSYYGTWGIQYVLFVGNYADVPMRYCYPNPDDHIHNPGNSGFPGGSIPTDYYFADLSLSDADSWDSDGDGYHGEYLQDSPDFLAEVYVGRIPTSDTDRITYTLNKLVAFEEDAGAWKDQALQPGSILFYENQDYGGYPKIDGSTLLNKIEVDLMSGWTVSRYTEKEGLDPSSFPWPAVSLSAFIDDWRSGQYGIVNWSGHGAPYGVGRTVWEQDDGDGVPETDGSDVMSNPMLIDAWCNLDDDYPSIVFAVSCNVGYPEPNGVGNLGIDLLTKPGFGASAGIVSSSRPAWISANVITNPGGAESICYEFNRYMIGEKEKLGEAMYDAKYFCYQNYGWDHYGEYVNQYNFDLYGDPSLMRTNVITNVNGGGLAGAPDAAVLKQNYPNPFNPTTTIRFDLPRPAHVKLSIYNVKGELVATLVDRHMTEGRKELSWAGRDGGGRSVASGVYFYRLTAGDFVQTKKMVLLR
jgi:hypothetical protein